MTDKPEPLGDEEQLTSDPFDDVQVRIRVDTDELEEAIDQVETLIDRIHQLSDAAATARAQLNELEDDR